MALFVHWLMKIAVYNYSESLEETKHCHVYTHMYACLCMYVYMPNLFRLAISLLGIGMSDKNFMS